MSPTIALDSPHLSRDKLMSPTIAFPSAIVAHQTLE